MKFGFLEDAEKFPKMVVVNVSYICNAKCMHCVHTINPSSRKVVGKDYFVNDAVFKHLADECGKYNAYIRITGTGEPLLHPNILELVKYAKGSGCKVSMITNGSLLTKAVADALLEYDIDGLEFSIDAVSKNVYEKIREGLNFDKLLENISYVKARRDSLKKKTNLIASFVEEDANRHERYKAESFWVPQYVDKMQFRVWLRYGKLPLTQDRRSLMSSREPCPYPFERINMDSRGEFHLCAFDIDHETSFGNIKNRSLESIWRCVELDNIRGLLLQKKFDQIPMCSKCTDWGCRSWKQNFWKLCEDASEIRKKS